MVDATFHSSYSLVILIAMRRGQTNPEHPWLTKLRQRYSKKNDYHLCECGKVFFCKYIIAYGVQNKKPAPRFRVSLPGQTEST
jgi:hypothetical protein